MRRTTWALLLPLLLALTSCVSPPRPPTVDEKQRRPANERSALELQMCRSDLQNTRILAHENSRLAETASARAAQLEARQRAADARQPAEIEMANTVYTIPFEFGSAKVAVPANDTSALISRARSSVFVLLRARTDGSNENPAESRIARERAAAVRDYLVQSGVDPTHIRLTWQPVGDAVASNETDKGRGLNRRVEIEMYRFAPRPLSSTATSPPA